MPSIRSLETVRLRLEPLEARHAALLFDGLRDEQLYAYIDEDPPVGIEALIERYQRWESRQSPDGSQAWLNWALFAIEEARYVGWIQATVHGREHGDVAYVLFRDAQGKGYGREAVAALIAHLVDDWAVPRLRAFVDARNRRSIALLEALGFTLAGKGSPEDTNQLRYERRG